MATPKRSIRRARASSASTDGRLEGLLDATGLRFALVASRFNERVTGRLLAGAEDCLRRHGAKPSDVTVVRVPGSWEIPILAARLAGSGRFDAIVAIGALVRGETPHFDVLAAEVARGLARVSLESRVPVAFGVLTTDTLEQATERAGGKCGNKGWEAAMSALEMASLLERLG